MKCSISWKTVELKTSKKTWKTLKGFQSWKNNFIGCRCFFCFPLPLFSFSFVFLAQSHCPAIFYRSFSSNLFCVLKCYNVSFFVAENKQRHCRCPVHPKFSLNVSVCRLHFYKWRKCQFSECGVTRSFV